MSIASPQELGTILGVWAHPDDETYLMAGIMAMGVRSGNRVVLATATRGEEGSWDHERYPPATMGAVRAKELRAALDVLGVSDHRWLDYHDGSCAEVPEDEAASKVAALIEEIEPDSVLTFGPEGLTGHPDHAAVSRWTTAAFERVGRPGTSLYYATQTPEWAKEWVPLMNAFTEVFAPGTPPLTERSDLGIDIVLDAEFTELKYEAMMRQPSQFEPFEKAFSKQFFLDAQSQEKFALAATK